MTKNGFDLQQAAAELWELALGQAVGVRARTDDVQALVRVLYEHKRKSGDPRLLQYTISQRGSTVLIAKTKPAVKTEGSYRPLEEP